MKVGLANNMAMYRCAKCEQFHDDDYEPMQVIEGYIDCDTGLDMELCGDCCQTVNEELYEMAYSVAARNETA